MSYFYFLEGSMSVHVLLSWCRVFWECGQSTSIYLDPKSSSQVSLILQNLLFVPMCFSLLLNQQVGAAKDVTTRLLGLKAVGYIFSVLVHPSLFFFFFLKWVFIALLWKHLHPTLDNIYLQGAAHCTHCWENMKIKLQYYVKFSSMAKILEPSHNDE